MLLFLNDNLQRNQSGIEHAQIKRLNLFKQFQEPAKIVTRQYSNELHMIVNEAGIEDQDFINLFDYFQDACLVPHRIVKLQDLHLNSKWKRKADGISYNYYDGKTRVMYVRRRNDRDRSIINLQYFDHFGKLLKVIWYDIRGFASVEQLYDWEGQIAVENYLRPNGQLALQKVNFKDRRQQKLTSYHLFDWHGKGWQFANFDELTRFFYDQLIQDLESAGNGPLGLVVDRVYELGWAVLNMHHRVFRVMQLHNDHVNDPSDMLHSTLNYNYQWGLDHLKDWDGVIALTPQQQADVEERFGNQGVKIYRIPGPIVSDAVLNAPHVDFKKRERDLVVMVARLSPEKQQDHLLSAWPKILRAVPDAHLELWGYANDNFDQKLKEQVKAEHLENSVTFCGYTTDVNAVYERAQLLILPSRAEGLPLSLVEAQSRGLPIVANDIKYGPADVVIDHQDGLLTKNGDIDGLAQAIISLLTNQQKLAEFSEHAYQDSARYSAVNVMKLWNGLLDDMKKGANN